MFLMKVKIEQWFASLIPLLHMFPKDSGSAPQTDLHRLTTALLTGAKI